MAGVTLESSHGPSIWQGSSWVATWQRGRKRNAFMQKGQAHGMALLYYAYSHEN